MVKIIISKSARHNLKEIVDYIKQDSVKYAEVEKIRIINEIDRLKKNLFRGKMVPELEDKFIVNYRLGIIE